ncbi:MAG TPA: pyridoxal phosphate-dependent aminotransferase [Casimicrobiaceae bacterium]|nr:pyridoxal phosphate-dependent aminotransferase [Casimicrobiaceae bacterium]
MPDTRYPIPEARSAVRALAASRIRDIANVAMHDPEVLAFWFGEPDEVTPAFIRDAATQSLAHGETFYAQNFGIPELRDAIARYVSTLHRPTAADEIAVTASGMNALMLAVEALVAPGDRVVVVTPLWPNLVEIPKILSADVVCVPLRFGVDGWSLDVSQLLDALTPGTRALLLNSPNNPTGWTIDREAQRALLAHCDLHGIWIVADDVYERLYYADDRRCAPSLLDIAASDMRVVSTNSFSKAWLMTGWRLGWIVAPQPLMSDLGKLIEYNTSCSPVFVQRAGVVALRDGEPTVDATRERLRRARNRLIDGLRTLPGVQVAPPAGAMYAFFRIEGVADSMAFCTKLVQQAKLGLAPGSAFGPEGEGFVRWCFAASDERLDDGIARLARFLASETICAPTKIVSDPI